MILRRLLPLILAALAVLMPQALANNPKREFRGAWLSSIYQNFDKTPTQALKDRLTRTLDNLQKAGCNAIIFQVRPSADALYESDIEPWSGWLTGKRGKAPSPYWDPMQFMLDEAHKRGMEFHAWINPYRVTISSSEVLPATHLSKKYPERFVRHGGQVFFDPAYQENRDHICRVIDDIVTRYDIDGIHFDDYFYPYPDSKGNKFNGDNASYAKFGKGRDRNEWRRENVDKLVEQVHETIERRKPWVRFGISPFGIHRNKKNDPGGSNTSGLQNYDDLHSDVLLWAREGWIDYVAPQLYWELDHKAASTRELAKWWNDNVKGADLYFGQDVERSMKAGELNEKMKIMRSLPDVDGNIWWTGYWLADNLKGARDAVETNWQSTLALPPVYGDPTEQPDAPQGLQIRRDEKYYRLSWDAATSPMEASERDVERYAIYEFFPDEEIDIDDPMAMVAVTPYNRLLLEASEIKKGSRLAVTAIDRLNRESKPAIIKVK